MTLLTLSSVPLPRSFPLFSLPVSFEIPPIQLLGDAVASILKAARAIPDTSSLLEFQPREPSLIYGQPVQVTIPLSLFIPLAFPSCPTPLSHLAFSPRLSTHLILDDDNYITEHPLSTPINSNQLKSTPINPNQP